MSFSEIYDPAIVLVAILFIGFVAGRLSGDREGPKR